MADNVTLPGTGAVVATDDVGGFQFQRVKVAHGADGSATDVSTTSPMPVNDVDAELGYTGGLTSYRERVVAPRYTILSDSIADGLATIWTSTVANGGTNTVSGGEGLIASGTSATGSAQLSSTVPLYLPGQSAWLLAAARFGDTGSAGNVRRLGAFTVSGTTPQNGFYYELDGTTFNAVTVKAGVATATAVASWSRLATAPFTPDANYHLFEIRWTANRAEFFIDNVLRHVATVTNSPITATLNFPMTVQSISTSGSTDRVLYVRNIGLGRFGLPDNQKVTPASETASGTITTQNLVPAGAATTGSAVELLLNGASGIAVQVTGTYTGALSLQATVDGATWVTLGGSPFLNVNTGAFLATITSALQGVFQSDVSAYTSIRLTALAAVTGTATVTIRSCTAAGLVALDAAIPAGANVIGALTANQSVNAAQINGVTPVMGNGVTGTGSQRVTIASDNSALPAAGQGATAAAVPAGATLRGMRAATANPTAVTDGQMVASMGDKVGRTVTTPVQIRTLMTVGTLSVAATAETTLIAAGGAGVFHDISQLIITTAGAAAQTITIKDATAGTTRAVFNYPNAATAPQPLVITFNPPIPQAAANANWTVTQSAATACNYTFVYAKNT